MSEQEETLERFGKIMENLSDEELEKLLIFGEGMVAMQGIMEQRDQTEKKAG